MTTETKQLPKPICHYCKKHPAEIDEYIEAAEVEEITPDDYVRAEEGTYNPETGNFACTACYIDIGMPANPWPGPAWKAP